MIELIKPSVRAIVDRQDASARLTHRTSDMVRSNQLSQWFVICHSAAKSQHIAGARTLNPRGLGWTGGTK